MNNLKAIDAGLSIRQGKQSIQIYGRKPRINILFVQMCLLTVALNMLPIVHSVGLGNRSHETLTGS